MVTLISVEKNVEKNKLKMSKYIAGKDQRNRVSKIQTLRWKMQRKEYK